MFTVRCRKGGVCPFLRWGQSPGVGYLQPWSSHKCSTGKDSSEAKCSLSLEKTISLKTRILEGLRPLVNKYRDTGILIISESPCNTPILPVKKPDGSYRFIQDLRAVNEAVVPIHPIVPNPYTLLSQVPGNAKYFSVLDLKDAFFCIPLHPESPKFFAFEWRDLETREAIQLCWTWLPQGFRDRPHIFGTSLGRELRELTLTNSNLIQYVDDLLITSPNFTSSQMDTIKTLNFLWVLYLIQKKRVIEYPPRKLRLA